MKILIVTRSFVREVSALIQYAAQKEFPATFSLIMPYLNESLSVPVSIRKLYFPTRMRTACYSPALMADILAFRPDILHIFEEFSGGIAFQTLLINRLLGRKSKVMVYSAENLPNNMHPIFRMLRKYVTGHADLAFVCSHGVKDVLKEEGFTKPIEVFPLGADTEVFYKFSVERLKRELKLDGKFVIGYIGRLLEIKGVILLIEMMRQLPEHVHLLMVGTGPEEQNLQARADEYHLTDRIHFIGQIPYPQLPQYINCMDIGIVPSKTTKRWKEQFGRVLVEFMSCEVPVIGSDSGSIPEVLGNVGRIFLEDNLQKLVQIVKSLMEQPEKRCELGQRGRERAERLYSTEMMCKQLFAMYTRLFNSVSSSDGK